MVSLRSFFVFVLAAGIVACSAPGASSSDGGSASDRLVMSELSSVTGMSAYDVIDNYKSLWLRKRGQNSIHHTTPIKVYVDGMGSPQGSISALRDIPAADIESIEYYDARRAQMQFGLDNSSGAILVNTKRGS